MHNLLIYDSLYVLSMALIRIPSNDGNIAIDYFPRKDDRHFTANAVYSKLLYFILRIIIYNNLSGQ